MCSEFVDVDDARLVSIKKVSDLAEGQETKLDLLMGRKGSKTVYSVFNDSSMTKFEADFGSLDFIPLENTASFEHSKILLASQQKQDYLNYVNELQKALETEKGFFNEESSILALERSLNEAIHFSEMEHALIYEKPEKKQENWSNYFFFYVAADNPLIYLSKFCFEMLLWEYKKVEDLPLELKVKK